MGTHITKYREGQDFETILSLVFCLSCAALSGNEARCKTFREAPRFQKMQLPPPPQNARNFRKKKSYDIRKDTKHPFIVPKLHSSRSF